MLKIKKTTSFILLKFVVFMCFIDRKDFSENKHKNTFLFVGIILSAASRCWSRQRESNPPIQLGKLTFYR